MTKRWAIIIVFTVVVLVIWTGWLIFKGVEKEEEVDIYSQYATSIESELDTELIKKITASQGLVIVPESEITPQK